MDKRERLRSMGRSKVTSGGQVTLPKELREQRGSGLEMRWSSSRGKEAFDYKASATLCTREWAGYLKHLQGRDPDDLVREMRDSWEGLLRH
jgi:hypothetical protein